MLKLNKKEKGSFTVEATLIFPLIMFIMFAIVYLTIIHYQNNVMIAESIRAMNRAGAYYQYIDMDGFGNYIKIDKDSKTATPLPFDSNIPKDGIIDIDMIKNRNVYRSVIDIFTENTEIGKAVAEVLSIFFNVPIGAKRENTMQYLNARVSGIQFKQYVKAEIDSKKVSDNSFMFLAGVLSADVGKQYINPLQKLSQMFLEQDDVLEKNKTKTIEVDGIISNQVELARNLDTVYDIGINLIEHFKK